MVQGLADYAQKFTHYAAWWNLTLHLPYSKGADNARLLLFPIACIHSLFIPQFVLSAANLIFGIEVKKHACKWLHGAFKCM